MLITLRNQNVNLNKTGGLYTHGRVGYGMFLEVHHDDAVALIVQSKAQAIVHIGSDNDVEVFSVCTTVCRIVVIFITIVIVLVTTIAFSHCIHGWKCVHEYCVVAPIIIQYFQLRLYGCY